MDFILFIISFTITNVIILFGLNVFLEENVLIIKIRESIHKKAKGIKLELIMVITSITIGVILGRFLGDDGTKLGVVLGVVMSVLSFVTGKGSSKVDR